MKRNCSFHSEEQDCHFISKKYHPSLDVAVLQTQADEDFVPIKYQGEWKVSADKNKLSEQQRKQIKELIKQQQKIKHKNLAVVPYKQHFCLMQRSHSQHADNINNQRLDNSMEIELPIQLQG